MADRNAWREVLDAEARRWSALPLDELLSELQDLQAYEVECDSKKYQVEVEVLENTGTYVHVMVAVDDGCLPGAISPVTTSFVRSKLNSVR
jgi:hypothetical protein